MLIPWTWPVGQGFRLGPPVSRWQGRSRCPGCGRSPDCGDSDPRVLALLPSVTVSQWEHVAHLLPCRPRLTAPHPIPVSAASPQRSDASPWHQGRVLASPLPAGSVCGRCSAGRRSAGDGTGRQARPSRGVVCGVPVSQVAVFHDAELLG